MPANIHNQGDKMSQRYTLIGNGEQQVIAGHTWFADHSTYRPMFPYLDTEKFTYAFVDFRGYGKSASVAGEFSTAEMGSDLLACADSLGWRRFHLLGNSMGGQAAQWVASHFPERVKSLALLSSVPAEGAPLEGDTLAFFRQAGADITVREQIAATVTGGRYSKHFAQWIGKLSADTAPAKTVDAYLDVWMSGPGDPSPSVYEGPVKAFAGEFDPVLTLAATEQSIGKHFRHCEVEEIKSCGHFAPVEAPVYTAAAIEAFFIKNAG
jgi:pimeloyl-ACP methyl ester carboxylesterase